MCYNAITNKARRKRKEKDGKMREYNTYIAMQHDQRVVSQPKSVQLVQHTAHLVIEPGHARKVRMPGRARNLVIERTCHTHWEDSTGGGVVK